MSLSKRLRNLEEKLLEVRDVGWKTKLESSICTATSIEGEEFPEPVNTNVPSRLAWRISKEHGNKRPCIN